MAFPNEGNGFRRKVMHVCEQAAQPMHIPIVIDGQCVVVTHQAFCRSEYVRQYSYCQMGPNGALVPIQLTDFQAESAEHLIAHVRQVLSHSPEYNAMGMECLPRLNPAESHEAQAAAGGNDENLLSPRNCDLADPPSCCISDNIFTPAPYESIYKTCGTMTCEEEAPVEPTYKTCGTMTCDQEAEVLTPSHDFLQEDMDCTSNKEDVQSGEALSGLE